MAPSTEESFQVTRDTRGVATVSMDVPGRTYNVFTEEVFAELERLLAELERDRTVRLVLFQSGKDSGFHVGADLRTIAAMQGPEAADRFLAIGQRVFDQLERLPMPTVSLIHGPCLGGGLEFALACRYRLARDDASTRLGLPEVKLGLLPGWGGTQRLPALVGPTAAIGMLLTARKLTACEAVQVGLVDAVWPPERFADGVEQFVADRLEGRSLRRPDPGLLVRLRERTTLGRRNVLRAAHRRLDRNGQRFPAVPAVLDAVEQGLLRGLAAGLAREREIFPELLATPVCRARLDRFLRRSRARTARPWVEGLTIGAVLRETARRFPARDAMVFSQDGARLTWEEFDRQVDRAAQGLLALGFRQGDRLGVWSTNWPEWVLLQFATARIGVILVTINPAYRAAELEYTLAQSELRGLALIEQFKSSSYLSMLREVCPELDSARPGELHSDKFPHLQWVIGLRGLTHPGVLAWRELADAAERAPADRLTTIERQLAPGDPVNLQYTSGTTGLPKGALLSHRNLLLNAFYAAEGQRLSDRDRICIPVPLYHCFGCVLGTMCAAVSGAAMIFPRETFVAAATLEAVEAERCTSIYGVPTMFIVELEHPSFRDRDLSSLRTGIMAGSPCPVEIMKRVTRDMGAREITIAYGQTEASPLVTMTRTDDPIELRVGTVGRPLPGIEVKIIEPLSGQPLPDGQPGELCCRGHDVMLGYYNMPEATAAAIDADGWLHTGDIAVRQTDGYFRITGRLKELIIRGGENIAPREIEELLYQHPKVEQVAVVGVPDRKFGEEVLAWIKLRAGETATPKELRDFCRQHLAHFKTPGHIKFVDGFPMTVTGKIQKYKIRQQAIEELGLQEVAFIHTA